MTAHRIPAAEVLAGILRDGFAVLADFDGVLVNSLEAQRRTWGWWAGGKGLDASVFVNDLGRTAREKIEDHAPHLNAAVEAVVIAGYETVHTHGVEALPGALALLTTREPLAVVTSGTRPLVSARLRTAGLPIPGTIISAEDVRTGKPAPEPFLRGAAALGRDPDECVAIEDAPAGIRSATEAGVGLVVGVSTTVPAERLYTAGAHVVVPDVAAYLDLTTSPTIDSEYGPVDFDGYHWWYRFPPDYMDWGRDARIVPCMCKGLRVA